MKREEIEQSDLYRARSTLTLLKICRKWKWRADKISDRRIDASAERAVYPGMELETHIQNISERRKQIPFGLYVIYRIGYLRGKCRKIIEEICRIENCDCCSSKLLDEFAFVDGDD
ncbi:MAG: hypothetical protein WBV55_02010 [Candidatus Sulfotelmatobacter sp.]